MYLYTYICMYELWQNMNNSNDKNNNNNNELRKK